METARVDIIYRPLRIAWAVLSDDRASFRKAVQINYTLCGGRYNPIVLVDRDEAKAQIALFRPDFIMPLGNDVRVAAFVKEFPFLINPMHSEALFLPRDPRPARAEILDIQNTLYYNRDRAEWKAMVTHGFRIPQWDDEDPLADALLIQYGKYPDPASIGIDYGTLLSEATMGLPVPVSATAPLPTITMDHPGISSVIGYGLQPHYSRNSGWDYHGHYIGTASSIDDLSTFWNLRAAGNRVMFFDLEHKDRFKDIFPEYERRLRADLAGLEEYRRDPAVWFRTENRKASAEHFSDKKVLMCEITPTLWNGLNLAPVRMHLGEESALGVLGETSQTPRISFAFNNKPFADHNFFYTQHLVASISMLDGLGERYSHLFTPPYIPELNEFVARSMYYDYRALKLEPESVGLIINTTKKDVSLTALPIPKFIEKVFGLAGFDAKLSGSGLITTQLISRMGGIDSTRAFKIPGVRRLLKTYGPNSSFTRKAAIQLIGSTDLDNPGASFEAHKNLYIEARPSNSSLTPSMVFSHLVEKKLFRIGTDLNCPTCSLSSWIALDALQQQVTCPLCGTGFVATRQLVEGTFTYRRSGVLGLEKNNQGAIPVALLLQQLANNSISHSRSGAFGASYDLKPTASDSNLPTCETDFVVFARASGTEKTSLIVGECKDSGGKIDSIDVENMRKVADAFPTQRFEVYILFAKLAPFTSEEIKFAASLNSTYHRRVIMLTSRELEPYFMFERTSVELGRDLHVTDAEGMANVTHSIYFTSNEVEPLKG